MLIRQNEVLMSKLIPKGFLRSNLLKYKISNDAIAVEGKIVPIIATAKLIEKSNGLPIRVQPPIIAALKLTQNTEARVQQMTKNKILFKCVFLIKEK